MSTSRGGRGRGRSSRTDSGRGAQQTPRNDPVDLNEANTFSGLLSGGFLDPSQAYGHYMTNMNDPSYAQIPFHGMGTDLSQAMQFLHSSREQIPIQPNVLIIDGSGGNPLFNQQYGSANMQYNSNQWMPPPRVPSHSTQNEGVSNQEAGRDRQSPTPDPSEAGSVENKIYLQPDGDT